MGANITAVEPAGIRAILIRTEVPRGVDRTRTSPGADHYRRGRAGRLGMRIEPWLTDLAKGVMDISGERLGFFGAPAAGFAGLEGRLRWGTGMVRPPDMDEETNQDQSNQ